MFSPEPRRRVLPCSTIGLPTPENPSRPSSLDQAPALPITTGFFRGKKFSERIPQDQAAQVERDVDNYRRFQTLAEEYVTVSDHVTRLQDRGEGSKKNSSRKRSPTNNSRKPPPS
jgi:hypothetical protein